MLLKWTAVALAVIGVSPAAYCEAASQSVCSVQVPVYDAQGNRLPFKITGVAFVQGSQRVDLLQTPTREGRMRAEGDRLLFPSRVRRSRSVEVTLEDGRGNRIRRQIVLVGCMARWSVVNGEADTGADVWGSRVTGRVSGCNLSGDWWIRATPMFGEQESPQVSEGAVRHEDGTFSLWVTHGARHIAIVGKDKQPIKAFGFDVTAGVPNEIGTVDLRGLCPSSPGGK
jgi:hypothetical protein